MGFVDILDLKDFPDKVLLSQSKPPVYPRCKPKIQKPDLITNRFSYNFSLYVWFRNILNCVQLFYLATLSLMYAHVLPSGSVAKKIKFRWVQKN